MADAGNFTLTNLKLQTAGWSTLTKLPSRKNLGRVTKPLTLPPHYCPKQLRSWIFFYRYRSATAALGHYFSNQSSFQGLHDKIAAYFATTCGFINFLGAASKQEVPSWGLTDFNYRPKKLNSAIPLMASLGFSTAGSVDVRMSASMLQVFLHTDAKIFFAKKEFVCFNTKQIFFSWLRFKMAAATSTRFRDSAQCSGRRLRRRAGASRSAGWRTRPLLRPRYFLEKKAKVSSDKSFRNFGAYVRYQLAERPWRNR